METVHERIGKNLKAILQKKEMTAESVAHQLGKSKGHLSDILSGKVNVTVEYLADIARVVGVDISEIFKS